MGQDESESSLRPASRGGAIGSGAGIDGPDLPIPGSLPADMLPAEKDLKGSRQEGFDDIIEFQLLTVSDQAGSQSQNRRYSQPKARRLGRGDRAIFFPAIVWDDDYHAKPQIRSEDHA